MALTMTDRLAISNAAIEAGGKAGIFPFDEVTKAYVDQHVNKAYEPVAADADAVYCRVVNINLSELKPVVAFPHLPGNTKRVEDNNGTNQGRSGHHWFLYEWSSGGYGDCCDGI